MIKQKNESKFYRLTYILIPKLVLEQKMFLSQQQKSNRSHLNLEKLLLYVSVTDNDLPTITLTAQQSIVATQLRIYFNDEQLILKHQTFKGDHYLASQDFQNSIAQVLEEFRYEVGETGRDWGFLQFLEYWVKHDARLIVQYQLFDEVHTHGIEKYIQNLVRVLPKKIIGLDQMKAKVSHTNGNADSSHYKKGMFSKIKNNKNNKDNSDCLSKSSASKTSIRQTFLPHLSPNQQPNDPFNYYLQKFFVHYSKKSTPSLKTQQFQKLEHFYTTLNLNKFMTYCKEIGLLKAHKSITVKYIQHLFVGNQDERHVVEYEGFVRMVREVLIKIFGEDQVDSKGYVLIGVRDRKGFVEKMRDVGVIVPLKKVIFAKPKKARDLTAEYGQQLKRQQQLQSKRVEEQKQNSIASQPLAKNGGYEQAYQSAWQKIHSTAPQGSFLPHLLPHGQSNSKLTAHLQQLLEWDDEDDPYLKRFKRANDSQKGEQVDEREKSGVIGRMQKRMQNVVRRVR